MDSYFIRSSCEMLCNYESLIPLCPKWCIKHLHLVPKHHSYAKPGRGVLLGCISHDFVVLCDALRFTCVQVLVVADIVRQDLSQSLSLTRSSASLS